MAQALVDPLGHKLETKYQSVVCPELKNLQHPYPKVNVKVTAEKVVTSCIFRVIGCGVKERENCLINQKLLGDNL
jgi:hypothetical protein